MATYLISILAALAVVMIIIVLGLILAKILINRAENIQTETTIPSTQSQGVFVDVDNLPKTEQQSGIVVISNDIMEDTRSRQFMKKNVSFTGQDAQIDHISNKNVTIPTMFSSEKSQVTPITNKITLDY
jgi:competence protein ComGF